MHILLVKNFLITTWVSWLTHTVDWLVTGYFGQTGGDLGQGSCYCMFIFLFMILSCIYLGHSGNTVLISNLQCETKSGSKYRETSYKWNPFLDYIRGIYHWEYWIGIPNTIEDPYFDPNNATTKHPRNNARDHTSD